MPSTIPSAHETLCGMLPFRASKEQNGVPIPHTDAYPGVKMAFELDVRRSFADDRAIWSAPRLAVIGDGRLVVNCASQDFPEEAESWRFPESRSCFQTSLWFSEDEGRTWTDRHLTDVEGLC